MRERTTGGRGARSRGWKKKASGQGRAGPTATRGGRKLLMETSIRLLCISPWVTHACEGVSMGGAHQGRSTADSRSCDKGRGRTSRTRGRGPRAARGSGLAALDLTVENVGGGITSGGSAMAGGCGGAICGGKRRNKLAQ